MFAGISRIDITPNENVEMAGMLREHASVGVHDHLYARSLVISMDSSLKNAYVITSMDLVGMDSNLFSVIRKEASQRSGIPYENMILACTHTHSGPDVRKSELETNARYIEELKEKIVKVIEEAASDLKPALLGSAKGKEDTISHYRRLMADDGHIVMNWEPYPEEHLIGPTGEVDPDLGVLKITDAQDPSKTNVILFNHAGHPNVLSGDNYLISADYPGRATELIDKEFGGISMFVNGAQGTMDIDGLRDRDWEGRERIGNALANAVSQLAKTINPQKDVFIRGKNISYEIPARKISDAERKWAEDILAVTGGKIAPVADGVGNDFKAVLYKRLWEKEDTNLAAEHVCIAIDDTAFISFPGELFTEIGMQIKAKSPFKNTFIIGLSNAAIGYIPTREAIAQGGYEVDTRGADDSAQDLILEHTVKLLNEVYSIKE